MLIRSFLTAKGDKYCIVGVENKSRDDSNKQNAESSRLSYKP